MVEGLQSICAMVFGDSQCGSGTLFKGRTSDRVSIRPNGKGRLRAGEGDAEQEPEEAAEDEGFAARALPAPPRSTTEMVASHNVSHIPFRSWCSHCVRGRGKSYYHKKVSHEADDPSRPVVSLDY